MNRRRMHAATVGARPVDGGDGALAGRLDPREPGTGEALRGAGLLALLVRRTPQLGEPGLRGTGDPDQRDRRHHVAHPRWFGGRDAAALLQPEGGRAVPPAGRHRAGTDRSGTRPCAWIGRAHRLRAQSAGRDRSRSFPGAGARSAGVAGGREAGGRPSVPRHHRPARRGDHARGLDARQFGLWPAGRRVFRPAVLLRAFHHRRPRRGSGDGDLPRGLSAERTPSDAARRPVRLGDGGGDRGGGGTSVHLARDVAARARPRRVRGPAVTRRGRGLPVFRGRDAADRAVAVTRAVRHACAGGREAACPGAGAWRGGDRHSHNAA